MMNKYEEAISRARETQIKADGLLLSICYGTFALSIQFFRRVSLTNNSCDRHDGIDHRFNALFCSPPFGFSYSFNI